MGKPLCRTPHLFPAVGCAKIVSVMSPAIEFQNISKRFVIHHHRPRSLQEAFVSLFRRTGQGSREEIWALREVDFQVQEGETLGLIGPNGSGKSTTLKLIARILVPTSGTIKVKGRVSGLLELGAGFHPDLTGRENILLNGSIMGLTRREIDGKMGEIIQFAGLERFIDTPLKHYSSGMQVRLGFSTAIHVEPQILLIDEVLAVGDLSFQIRCLDKIAELKRQGVTILLVSHNLDAIRKFCDRVIWLDAGLIGAQGEPEEVINTYLTSVLQDSEQQLTLGLDSLPRARWGTKEVEIVDLQLLDSGGTPRSTFSSGEKVIIRISYLAHRKIERPIFSITLFTEDGVEVARLDTHTSGADIGEIGGRGEVDYTIHSLPFLEGKYELSGGIYDRDTRRPYDHHHRMYRFTVEPRGKPGSEGIIDLPWEWRQR